MFAQVQDRKDLVEESLRKWVHQLEAGQASGLGELKSSIEYSLNRGGKRFRPVLALLLAEGLAVSPKRVLPWAMAIEMIHTYSLIHDDLPCMDNDDERRGEPTNHKIFGESTALLAGDSLLTEAFGVLATAYPDDPAMATGLIQILVEAAGYQGMIGGQAIDLKSQGQSLELDELIRMHEMKTGALIRASCEGAAFVCGIPLDKRKTCREFGALLGFAFQLKDDLLDSTIEIEKGSMPAKIGLVETENLLQKTSTQALSCLEKLGLSKSHLGELVQMNLDRQH